jgi:hypothetical protein
MPKKRKGTGLTLWWKDGTSQQILQDIAKVFESTKKIGLAKGTLIAGIGNRKGRQPLQQHASCINVHGGKRVHQPEKDRVHPDAYSAYALKLGGRMRTRRILIWMLSLLKTNCLYIASSV